MRSDFTILVGVDSVMDDMVGHPTPPRALLNSGVLLTAYSDYENQIVGQIRFLISALARAEWVLGNGKGGPF